MKVIGFIIIWVEISGGRLIEKSCDGTSEDAEFLLEPLRMKHKGITVMPGRLAVMPVFDGGG